MSTKYTAEQRAAYWKQKALASQAPPPAPAKRTYVRKAPVNKIVGHGDYYKAPKSIRPSKKTTNSLGGSIGAHLGHGVQAVIKALTGFGDYEVESNSLMPSKLGGDPPIIRNTKNNSHIVHHREYIGDVYASSGFSINTYSINPGLVQTFPWASQVADSYEQYKFRGLVFEYKSMSSDAVLSTAASSALGTVIMSTQYDTLDPAFTDKRTMENYEYANSTKPSCSMLHPVECKMSQTSVSELYVRTGAITAGDSRLYDLGKFSIAVQGMQNPNDNEVIGELWCTFELELFKPKLLVGGGALLTDHFGAVGSSIFTLTAPFATQGTMGARSGNNLGCTIQVAASSPYGANSIIFPRFVVDGFYKLVYTLVGSVATAASPTYTAAGTTVNIDVVSTDVMICSNNTASYFISPQATLNGNLSFTVVQILKIIQTAPGIAAGIQLAFDAGAFPTGLSNCDLMITQLSPSVN